jgi:hexosaminidase
MYWGSSKNMKNLTDIYPNLSYILAPADYYYLDCGFGQEYGDQSWCDPMKTWYHIYTFEPSDFLPESDPRVLGTEVPVWSEIMNEDALFQKIWPRSASMADKMWGPKVEIDLVALAQR